MNIVSPHVLTHFAAVTNVLFQKISILPPWKVFWFEPPHPSGNSSLGSHMYFPLKLLAFKTPSPSEFPMPLCSGGMDIF